MLPWQARWSSPMRGYLEGTGSLQMEYHMMLYPMFNMNLTSLNTTSITQHPWKRNYQLVQYLQPGFEPVLKPKNTTLKQKDLDRTKCPRVTSIPKRRISSSQTPNIKTKPMSCRHPSRPGTRNKNSGRLSNRRCPARHLVSNSRLFAVSRR